MTFDGSHSDLMLTALFAWMATAFKYLGPYTLKRILYVKCVSLSLVGAQFLTIHYLRPRTAIETPTPSAKADAYLFAFIALLANISQAQFEALLAWHARRAGIRSKTVLIAEIYKKALRRRDMGGAPAGMHENNEGKAGGDKGKGKGNGKGKQRKEGRDAFNADIGKIVNVMSGDTNKVCECERSW